MESLITEEIGKLHSSDFYIGKNIPTKKLENAFQSYSIDAHERIFALIDSTILGSAKNGMAIGLKGIYWNNDWATKTNKKFLSWAELDANKIHPDGMNILLAPGCVFSLAGSNVKPVQVELLLKSIISRLSHDTQEVIPTQKQNAVASDTSNHVVGSSSKSESANPFKGSYDDSILQSVQSLVKRHRLSSKVYIAPKIQISTVKTILDITKDNINPYGIWMVIDNTFLQTGKDFLILTTDSIYAKSIFNKVEKFSINEIRKIHSNDLDLYINNYKIQCFDQFEEYEVTIISEALEDLVSFLKNVNRSSNSGLNDFVENAFRSSYDLFCNEISSDRDSKLNNFALNVTKKLESTFKIVISSYGEKYFDSERYFFYQLLYTYCILSAFLLKTSPISKDAHPNALAALKTISAMTIISIFESAEDNGESVIENSEHFLELFSTVFDATQYTSKIADLLFAINANSQAEKKAILLANDTYPKIASIFFRKE